DQLLAQLFSGFFAGIECDIDENALTLKVMGEAHYRRFGNFRACDQRALDFGSAHAVPGDVKNIVNTSGDPVIAIFIATGTVSCEVHALKGAEVGLYKAFMITKDGAHLPWPAIQNHQVAFSGAIENCPFVVDHGRLYPKEGQG